MTIRNTLARAARTGWITQSDTVAATPMARERVGRMASAMILRWELALEVMALLVRAPALATRLDEVPGIAALELNISCPNVSHGVDMGSDPELCRRVVAGVRAATSRPVLAKLTPNVADIAAVARGARDGGADAVTLINTCQGMAVDWRRRRPLLGNVIGGLSGPAIKPVALRCVHQVRRAVEIPIVGVGGIMTTDDVMEFLVTGASAVQVGTASFADPLAAARLLDELPAAVSSLGAASVAEIVGTLRIPDRSSCPPVSSAHAS
jgi:dihydroorotate dehydrogenase (NAD+) catalytic subunit